KALEYTGILDFYTSYLMQSDFNEFYADPKQLALSDPLILSDNELDKIKSDFLQKTFNTPEFNDALCSYLSRATGQIEVQIDDKNEVINLFEEGASFCKDQYTQF